MMTSRVLWNSILLTTPLVFMVGCSTPESQERLDTALCWLRPSCLPSQPKAYKAPAPPNTVNRSPAEPKPQVVPLRPTMPRCLTSAKAKIHSSKPYAIISYVEPGTKANGEPLTNLVKTTIYQDLGQGFVKYKDIPATKPEGGGTIQEKIDYSINKETSIETTICVTATNTNGQER